VQLEFVQSVSLSVVQVLFGQFLQCAELTEVVVALELHALVVALPQSFDSWFLPCVGLCPVSCADAV
jgi:hypothetical protein